jgi:hypothetical protein
MVRRQICWAHLLGRFASFAEDRRPEVARLGERLLSLGHALFRAWHRARDGTISRAELQRSIDALRFCVKKALEEGAALGLRGVSGSCEDMLAHRQALWTFLDKAGVEPANNEVERELRDFVLWREKSFGSQSERGTRFAERVKTTVHTLRKQWRHVLSFLTAAAESRLSHQAAPSLLPPRGGRVTGAPPRACARSSSRAQRKRPRAQRHYPKSATPTREQRRAPWRRVGQSPPRAVGPSPRARARPAVSAINNSTLSADLPFGSKPSRGRVARTRRSPQSLDFVAVRLPNAGSSRATSRGRVELIHGFPRNSRVRA